MRVVQNIFYQPPKSETSDHTSDNENTPPPRKILKKENQKQEEKQQPRKGHMQKRVRQVQEQVTIQPAMQEEQQLCITCSRVTGGNWKTFEYTATGRVQKLGSGAIRDIEAFKAMINKKHCRPYCH
jgi:hypothetical protein